MPCFYSRLKNAEVFALIHGTAFGRSGCWYFVRKIIIRQFLSKKRKIMNFSKQTEDTPHFPLRLITITPIPSKRFDRMCLPII